MFVRKIGRKGLKKMIKNSVLFEFHSATNRFITFFFFYVKLDRFMYTKNINLSLSPSRVLLEIPYHTQMSAFSVFEINKTRVRVCDIRIECYELKRHEESNNKKKTSIFMNTIYIQYTYVFLGASKLSADVASWDSSSYYITANKKKVPFFVH